MTKRIEIIGILFFVFCSVSFSQNRDYVNKVVKTLASPKMEGRGYVNNGCNKAADFLANEMKIIGLQYFGNDYFQTYQLDINTFPGKMDMKIDGKKVKSGSDFVVHSRTKSIKKNYELVYLPDTITLLSSVYQFVDTNNLEGKMLVIPETLKNAYKNGIIGVDALIQTVSESLWWHVSGAQNADDKVSLKIKKESLPLSSKHLSVDIEAEKVADFETKNVIGYVRGNTQPDSFAVFIGHYDHLGRMGKKTYFPGASDNATGTAAVLDLARYYAAHPEKAHYTMVFVLVSGEEAGLLGSTFNAENPQFSFDKTRLVINFDMVGTGSEGITIVQGKVFSEMAEAMMEINRQEKLVPDIALRGESCNSDHCPYYQKGVPALFIYTRGKENLEYHTVTDTFEKVPFTIYESFFKLITKFVDQVKSPLFNRKPLENHLENTL